MNILLQIKGVVNNDGRAKIQGYITQVLVDEGLTICNCWTTTFRLETNMLTENADAAKSGISAAQANVQASKAAATLHKLK